MCKPVRTGTVKSLSIEPTCLVMLLLTLIVKYRVFCLILHLTPASLVSKMKTLKLKKIIYSGLPWTHRSQIYMFTNTAHPR